MCDTASLVSARLLRWYDSNARDLPWRVSPDRAKAGVRADPYWVWLSEIMLQQTTVAAVTGYFDRFIARWPTVAALARAKDDDVMAAWAGLGYYARARNLLKCARMIDGAFEGRFPTTAQALADLAGIGPYTAAAIAAIAFDRCETVVDGNVERVIARYHAVDAPLPQAKPKLRQLAATHTPAARPGDYAQAVMDLGATVCTPNHPMCRSCPLMDGCEAYKIGAPALYPHRTKKPPKLVRRGFAYVVRRSDGAWMLERRPEKGLLGGMFGWPCSEWGAAPHDAPPMRADWVEIAGEVRHTFTHFHLILTVRTACIAQEVPMSAKYQFVQLADFRRTDLPTVMRKVYDIVAT